MIAIVFLMLTILLFVAKVVSLPIMLLLWILGFGLMHFLDVKEADTKRRKAQDRNSI